ncbi:DUF4405 domain-containing protein [Brachyspira murdochii]|uniref:DUF4405 domain-containing protein n=1 Tax=Brachyspira murdochii TaxID=84378 RepID=UPI00300485EC
MKNKIKILIDITMTILFFVLIGYRFTGRTIHEYLGYSIFIFFILHHILNFHWYKNLNKGKYSFNRTLNTFINSMLFICMIGLIISGILFNRNVVDFFNLEGIKVFNKRLHIICCYWGLVLMSVHLGMHWGIFINMSKKLINIKKQIYMITGLLIAIYGVVSFIKRGIYIRLFSVTKVPSYEEAFIFFFMDHLAIMGLFIFITYYLHRLSNKLNKVNTISKQI